MFKILLAALLGGILMFCWEGFSHEVLPLGEAGLRGLDGEAGFMAVIKGTVKQSGLYIFPGGETLQPGLSGPQKEEVMKKATDLWMAGPSGIMVVRTEGVRPDSPAMLIRQCVFDILVTLIAAMLLSWTSPRLAYSGRVLFVATLGLIPTLNAELPLWNWYGFPSAYIGAQAAIHLGGFVIAGLVVAKLVKGTALS